MPFTSQNPPALAVGSMSRLTNVNNGKYLDTANGLVYFNDDILRAAVSSGLFMFPCNVLYCGYNREIEKLPITASIA